MPWMKDVSKAAPSTMAASMTCPRPDRERSYKRGEDTHREEHAAAAEVADEVEGVAAGARRRGRGSNAPGDGDVVDVVNGSGIGPSGLTHRLIYGR